MTCLRAVAGALLIVATLTSGAHAAPAPDPTPTAPAPGPAPGLVQGQPAAERAAAVARQVDALLARNAAAVARVRAGVDALTTSFTRTQAAEAAQGSAEAAVERQRIEHARRVRAVYAGGGGLGLKVTVLTATDPQDVLWRQAAVDRVIGDLFRSSAAELRLLRTAAAAEQATVSAAEQADVAHGRELEAAQRDAAAAAATLAEARATLAELDVEVRRQKAAADAARRLAEAEKANRGGHGPTGPITPLGIPAEYERAYRAAAPTCPGLRWTLLAAVGQVESGHGRNTGPSSAGAIGPMQFMPATFRAYAVDGDNDGLKDAWDPEDAIWSAARYLCVSGARGGSDEGVHDALFAYNRAEWYVQLVLATERAILKASAAL